MLPKLLLRICAGASMITSAGAIAQTSAADTARDGSHDMDFAFGNWRTDVTIIKDPFNAQSPTVHMTGTKKVTPIWGGKGLLEEIEGDSPGGHWEAANVTFYDPKAHQWGNYYVDSSDGQLAEAPAIGEYHDRNVEFYSQENVGGRAVLLRGVWKDIKSNSHTYEVARSIDGGRTWHTSFIAKMTRAK